MAVLLSVLIPVMCPFCARELEAAAIPRGSRAYRRCSKCDVYVLAPPPTAEELVAHYSAMY